MVFYMSCKKASRFLLGLVLCFTGNLSSAALMEQESMDMVSDPENYSVSDSIIGFEGETDNSGSRSSRAGQNESMLIPELMGSEGAAIDLDGLNDSMNYGQQNNEERRRFYSSDAQYYEPAAPQNVLSEQAGGTDIKSMLKPLVDDPELKEKARDVMDSLREVKDAITVNKQISYESSQAETERLVQRNLYQQKQQEALAQRGINNQVSKGKYDSSMLEDFFSKILTFVLYAIIGIILIKLLLMFVKWQRKMNRY